MHPLAKLDRRYIWHPFTQMRDWLKREPIVLVKGHGAVLEDARGRAYLDANSSIWTNLHGHNHPRINDAVQRQLKKLAHSSALGFANEPASLLAQQLVRAANPAFLKTTSRRRGPKGGAQPELGKIFFSDDGSTALEVALKLASEFSRRSGLDDKPRFLSLEGAYHGDTIGAVSLGQIPLFHRAYGNLLFKTDRVMAPYCYRCRFNRARPEHADARDYRKCNWECLDVLEERFRTRAKRKKPYAAFVFEPLMQGAAGMIPQPEGWLSGAAEIARAHGALLVADEVMTGFGRTGTNRLSASKRPNRTEGRAPSKSAQRGNPSGTSASEVPLFACHREGVQPDFLALAKGLTGGYVPMAATLTTQTVFDAFLGDYSEFKTFFHGHSFTGNQIGAAAALASMQLLQSAGSRRQRQGLEQTLRAELQTLWKFRQVGDIRQVGLVAGIELVRNWGTREPFPLHEQAGIRVCDAMAKHGVLTRPIGNVIVLMPPYCSSKEQIRKMVGAIAAALEEIF